MPDRQSGGNLPIRKQCFSSYTFNSFILYLITENFAFCPYLFRQVFKSYVIYDITCGLGHLFKKSGRSRARTELVVLITPYIINDSQEAEAATDAYQSSLGDWAQGVRERVAANRKAMASRNEPQALIQAPSPAQVPAIATPAVPLPTAQMAPVPQSSLPEPVVTSAPTAPGAGAAVRMVNLSTTVGTGAPTADPSKPDTQSGSVTQGAARPSDNAQPVGKPAPAKVQGVSIPAGATVVEDPELLRQILKATGR